MTSVAFQGVHGAYSEEAARRLFGAACRTEPLDGFEDVFRAVSRGKVDRGIIPIENSLAGSIHQNYDLLLSHRLHIVSEIHVRIEHALLCHRSASLGQIRQVRSHPQALAQCSEFFRTHRRLKPVAYFDTAGAAMSLRDEGLRDTAAIASTAAGKLYGLKVLRHHLENTPRNFTRFLAISRKPWRPESGIPTKCSIAFTPAQNRPGMLFRILGVFSLRDIDLLKIESRPDPESPFEYQFFIDLSGSPKERRVTNALDHLQEMVRAYRLLGAYPSDHWSEATTSRRSSS